MMKRERRQPLSEQPALQLKPLISYPRTAEAGEHYLLTIDVQLTPNSPWPYEEEEFEISFLLNTAPFFTHEPYGGEDEPGLVLHRFGGTYGPAEYLLTASPQAVPDGKMMITLLNGWGVPIAQLELDCEVRQEALPKTAVMKTLERGAPAPLPKLPSHGKQEDDIPQHRKEEIEQQLALAGWTVCNFEDIGREDPSTRDYAFLGDLIFPDLLVPSGNLALRGYPSIGFHYSLIIDRELVGIIDLDTLKGSLSDKENKSSDIALPYTITRPDLDKFPIMLHLPQDIAFTYSVYENEIVFKNTFESDVRGRKIYTFHQPSTLSTWLEQPRDIQAKRDSFRSFLLHLPGLEQKNLRDYQFAAIQQIEQSMARGDTRTLIQMETYTGKTHIAIHSIFRLLTYAHAKHIFYVVDIPPAKDYAFNSFQRFTLPGDTHTFTESYEVRMISDERLDPSVHVYIGTLEELYNLYSSGQLGDRLPRPALRGEDAEPSDFIKEYCAALPIEYFDAIFLAECEQINYQTWLPILDYFDTFYIGIADTVSERVLRFFNNNLVYSADTAGSDAPPLSSTLKDVLEHLHTDKGLSDYTDRLAQLSWFLLLKYLDDFEETEAMLNTSYKPIIAAGYRWRDWAQSLTDEPLLAFINNELIPYLANLRGESLHDLRTLIGTIFRAAHNRCRSGSILRTAIDLLQTLYPRSSDISYNLASEYELLLKEAHFASWNAEEYYTPRSIVRFMIDRLQPCLDESLLDPACGTAGLLIEAYERLSRQVYNPEQWRALQVDLLGIEKQPSPYLLGALNMLLHDIEIPNIHRYNALTTPIGQLHDADYVDVIAAHIPFGGQERLGETSQFSSDPDTGDTDLLFLRYCMAALRRPGGRAAIVLAPHVLFSGGPAASTTRRRLLTNFRVHTIIRLPDGVFAPYAGVPAVILFFEAGDDNTVYSVQRPCTQEVWSYEIPLPTGQRRYSEKFPIRDEDFAACLAWWDRREENEHAWRVTSEWLFTHNCNLDRRNPDR